MIYGNTDGIKDVMLQKIEDIYKFKISKDEIMSRELSFVLFDITQIIKREISIAIDRRGNVVSVAIGDSCSVEMPYININEKRLSGIRIIHTHPNGNSRLSAVDISALIKMKLDCIAAIGVSDEKMTGISVAFCTVKDNVLSSEITSSLSFEQVMKINFLDKVRESEMQIEKNDVVEDYSEKAILVGIEDEDNLNELEELADACGVLIVGKVVQRKAKIDPAFYVGSGKVDEIGLLCQTYRANVVIFDDELTASQVRNIEEAAGVKVIDRTTLILEIFARRARSKEAKIQVEMAQLKYRLPRLAGLGMVLSRTGGGIGTRGPGEKKLEVDRRHIKDRIYELKKELEKIRSVRETQRVRRSDMPKVSIIGYTNAGKSTLRNKLCEVAMPKEIAVKEKVYEADMLFATLDVTTRAVMLPDSRIVSVTDTVGFIKKLPHDLIEAFKSTLEEVRVSDLLIHVVDMSSNDIEGQIETVQNVLKELNSYDKPTLLVLNKIDLASEETVCNIKGTYKNTICISAKYGTNINVLLDRISEMLPQKLKKTEYLIPYDEQKIVAFLHRNCHIEKEEYRDEGTYIIALVDEETYNKCIKYQYDTCKLH